MPSARSHAIDALRGLAVLAVVLHHASLSPVGIVSVDSFLGIFREWGTLGVDLFFVLSGFCIHGAYSGKTETFNIKKYLSRRWWRIYPPYFFALSLAAILNLVTMAIKFKSGGDFSAQNFGFATIFSHLFLVHNWWTPTIMAVSGPFWTIALEAQYYLLYLLFRPTIDDSKKFKFLFLGALILHFTAWRLHEARFMFQPLEPFQYWVEWLIGAWLATKFRSLNGPSLNPIRDWAGFTVCLAAAVFVEPLRHTVPGSQTLLIAIGFAFLVWAFLGHENQWRVAVLRWLPAVGLFSYSIYLVHFLFLERLRVFVLPHLSEGLPRLAGLGIAVGISLAISALFFRYFEKPFLERAHKTPKSPG